MEPDSGREMPNGCLYNDSLVCITEESILFRRYYFPLLLPKRVHFSKVDHVEVLSPDLWSGSFRTWGSGDFRTWFPLDLHRPSRDAIFILFLKHKRTRIGFTVEDSKTVRFLFRERGLLGRENSA
jgi:hypothetical protein